MKAAVYTRYGPPEVVQITDVEKPIPKDNEVLIKVRVVSLNPLDWHFMRGTPYAVRIIAGNAQTKIPGTRRGCCRPGRSPWHQSIAVQTRRRGFRLVQRGLCRVRLCFRIRIGHEAKLT